MQSASNSAVEHVRRAVIRHISRKDLKRARSGLRLLRPLDEAGYQRENMRLRNAARRLSAVRDNKILLARLAELLAEETRPARRPRKKAKHLGQALEILGGKAPPKKVKKVLARADDVGDLLGDDHDLAVVETRLLARPAGGAKTRKKLRTRLEARRARLQKKALAAADKLFGKKTRRLLRRAAETP